MIVTQDIQAKIEALLQEHKLRAIQKSARELTQVYRENRGNIVTSLDSEEKILAYLSMRMPATYAAVCKVLGEIDDFKPESILDVGAGPGTAALAALNVFPELLTAHLIESNQGMIAVGKKIFSRFHSNIHSGESQLPIFNWRHQDYTQKFALQTEFDLSIFSYTLNEISSHLHMELIKKVWDKTRQFLVIVEPGSKQSFEFIHTIRKFCIENKIYIVAPCPHMQECPAFAEKDWCHFSVRVQRSSAHRHLKSATKNYEDEKFSYLILAREPVVPYTSRIVRRPIVRPGNIQLKLCTADGFVTSTLSKKDKEIYKQARKSDWGDTFV